MASDTYREQLEQFSSNREFAYGVLARAFDSPRYFTAGRILLEEQPTAQALLQEIQNWHAMASQVIADRIMQLELGLFIRQADNELDELDSHRLLDTLERPNPFYSGKTLLRLLSQWLSATGEAYLLKVTDRARLTSELWPLSPDRIRLITDDRVIVAYEHIAQGATRTYGVNEIIRIWFPNPMSHWEAEGVLGPQARASDGAKFLDETMREYWQHDATPKMALVPREGTGTPTRNLLTQFYAEFRRFFSRRFGSRRGLPVVLPSGFDVKEFAAFAGFDSVVQLSEHYRDKILMASRVPPFALGRDTNVNRSTGETTMWAMDQHAVMPQTLIMSEAFTFQLARDFDERFVVRFPDFVLRDKEFELEKEGQDLKLAVRSVNEIREERGLETVEWGDEPFIVEGVTGRLRAQSEEEESSGEVARSVVRLPPSISAEAWAQVVERERRFVPRFETAMRTVLTEQEKAIKRAFLKLERSLVRQIDFADVVSILRSLLDPERWIPLFSDTTEAVRRTAFEVAAEEAVGQVGSGTFRFSDAVSNALNSQRTEFIDRVQRTTAKELRVKLADVVAATDPSEALGTRTNRILDAVGEQMALRRKEARRIAHTEMLRATQAAQIEGFKQSGVVTGKRWNTSEDPLVRDSHDQVQIKEVPLDGEFVLGSGARALYPGDSKLPAADVINCRCFTTPVLLKA